MGVFYETMDFDAFFYEDKDILFPKHIHKQAEVFYVLEGKVKITHNNDEYIMSKDEVFTVFPNTVHSYESIGKTSFYIGLINVERLGKNRKYVLERACLHPVRSIMDFNENIQLCMKMMAGENKKGEFSKYPEGLCGYFNVIIEYLLEKLECVPIEENREPNLLKPILNFMNSHFSENITLDKVAREVGISSYYLSKLFAQKIGNGFSDYLNLLRIECGKELLTMTDRQVGEIAYSCGFQSESSFFRNFKELVGTTPLQYRKSTVQMLRNS